MFSVQARGACSKSGTLVRWTEVLDFDRFDFDPEIESLRLSILGSLTADVY